MFAACLKALWGDSRGNVAIVFGLMAVPLVGIVGLSIDTMRAYTVRHQLQRALDSAALAGGRLFSADERDAVIQNYFDQNIEDIRYGSSHSDLVITSDPVSGTLNVEAEAEVRTTLGRVLGVETLKINADVQVVRNETTLEVALAIDTTGSMGWNDSSGNYKMDAAKDAANLLLNILYNNKDEDEDVFVSVVPFVQNVNVGSNYSSWLVGGSEAAIPWNYGMYPDANGWRGCMFERINSSGNMVYETTDEPPSTQRFMPYVDHHFGPNCPDWGAGERGVVAGICRTSNGAIYSATSSGTAGSTPPTHMSGTASDGSVSWRYRRPAYPNAAGFNPVNCPRWRANETVARGECRFAPLCPSWQSGEAITRGDCRVSGGRMYSADSSGTTSGGSAPSHTSGTQWSGGISWRYRGVQDAGVGGGIFYANTSGTTGNAPPLHKSGDVSDGNVTWRFWQRMWVAGDSVAYNESRANPWNFVYQSRTSGTVTTTGTEPPVHASGSTTTGGVNWRYSSKTTMQNPFTNDQYGIGYNSGCGSPISPLSNSRLAAKARVDVLQPSSNYGGTMTPMGLVWAWRTISPQWRGLWDGTPADNPYNYDEADNYKAVIILTDGENVFSSCSGTFCRAYGTPYGYLYDERLGTDVSATAVSSLDSKVLTICQNIRATGTLLYAVMFDLPSGASATRTLFQQCVGDTGRFFDVVDQTELENAFKTIAVDLSRLRLSR